MRLALSSVMTNHLDDPTVSQARFDSLLAKVLGRIEDAFAADQLTVKGARHYRARADVACTTGELAEVAIALAADLSIFRAA